MAMRLSKRFSNNWRFMFISFLLITIIVLLVNAAHKRGRDEVTASKIRAVEYKTTKGGTDTKYKGKIMYEHELQEKDVSSGTVMFVGVTIPSGSGYAASFSSGCSGGQGQLDIVNGVTLKHKKNDVYDAILKFDPNKVELKNIGELCTINLWVDPKADTDTESKLKYKFLG